MLSDQECEKLFKHAKAELVANIIALENSGQNLALIQDMRKCFENNNIDFEYFK